MAVKLAQVRHKNGWRSRTSNAALTASRMILWLLAFELLQRLVRSARSCVAKVRALFPQLPLDQVRRCVVDVVRSQARGRLHPDRPAGGIIGRLERPALPGLAIAVTLEAWS